MSALRGLRLLLLGETWVVPIGVISVLGAATAFRSLAPRLWEAAGGLFLVMGVAVVLVASVRRRQGARQG